MGVGGGGWGLMGADWSKNFHRKDIEKTEIALVTTFVVGLG